MSWEQFGVEVGHGITGSQLLHSVSTGKKPLFLWLSGVAAMPRVHRAMGQLPDLQKSVPQAK